MNRFHLALILAAAGLAAGCANSSSSGSGLSTASVLGEAPPNASGESPGITRDDPMARPVQVAWTSARAQRCGFNFDAARLRANYLAFEVKQGAQPGQLANYERAFDSSLIKIKGNIADAQAYCTDKKSTDIKTDLTRHLAGNYEPNFPADKQLAQKTLWEKFAGNEQEEKLDPKRIWQQLEDKKNGVRTAQ